MLYFILVAILVLLASLYVLSSALSRRDPREPPMISGPIPFMGAGFRFATNPVGLLRDSYKKLGNLFTLFVMGQKLNIFIGEEAHKAFFATGEDKFSAAKAYTFTIPVFGKEIIYDAPVKEFMQQRRFVKDALTKEKFKIYIPMIEKEVEDYFNRKWGDSGEAELLRTMSEVTVITSTRCLQGKEIREEMSDEVTNLYFHLDEALSPIGFFYPNLPLPAMIGRDKARKRLAEIFQTVVDKRRADTSDEVHSDIVDVLMKCKYRGTEDPLPDHHITGMMIALLLAGQHTSNVSSAWLASHLAHDSKVRSKVVKELEDNVGDAPLDWEGLESCEYLGHCLSESLRLHPPIVMMMRKVLEDVEYNGKLIPKGSYACVAPCVSNRLEEFFTKPDDFEPERFEAGREEHKQKAFSYLSFGASRHACIGERFAKVQIKTIFAWLMRNYDFELVQPNFPKEDYTTLIVGPKPPIKVRYTRKKK